MNEFHCTPEMFIKCKKNALCYLCDGQRLYSPPKEKPQKTNKPRKKKEGMDFEKKVTKTWNQSNQNQARRQPNSGAIYALPGDIITPNELMECKERGTINTKGEKTFTINKNWIDKIIGEAARTHKEHWYVPFAFKNDKEIFVIKSFDHELELIQTIEYLSRENENLKNELKGDE